MPSGFGFVSGGCLFSLLAWAGILVSIASAFVSSLISLLLRNKAVVATFRVLLWFMPVVAFSLILGAYYDLVGIRQQLANPYYLGPKIGTSLMDTFRYLPPYQLGDDGYLGGIGYPTATEANIAVRLLRIGVAILLVTGIFALAGMLFISNAVKHGRGDKIPALVTPKMILGIGGLLVIIVFITFG